MLFHKTINLSMYLGDEITLAPTPTESSLPVSPIFIRNGSIPQTESSNDLLGKCTYSF